MRHFCLCFGLLFVWLAGEPSAGTTAVDPHNTRMLTQPTVSKSHIAFIYADDLWLCDLNGANPRRLTAGPGVKGSPKFSPDGQWIAFSANYDGNLDVYLIPAQGGTPRRLTFHPGPDIVRGFTPDGKAVLFNSPRSSFNNRYMQLYTVPLEGGHETALALPNAFKASYAPDGQRLAYCPLNEPFNQWKNYRGGTISRIWIYRFDNHAVEQIPQPAEGCNDADPMWIGDSIYFRSDRDGEFNLYAFDVKSQGIKKLTDFKDFPIASCGHGDNKIVLEQAGYLHLYDTERSELKPLTIGIAADLLEVRPRYIKGPQYIRNASISPSGARAVFEFRGEIVTVPAEKGDVRNLTQTPGVHERSPVWSPNGQSIAYFADQGGEYALHVRDQAGKNPAKIYKIQGGAGFYERPVWSPDSKKIAFRDNSLGYFWIDLATGKVKKFASDRQYGPSAINTMHTAWSHDSHWLAYTLNSRALIQSVYLYSLAEDKSYRITDGLSEVSQPVFDASGKYLYMIGSVDAGPVKQWFAQSNADMRSQSNLYIAVLRKDLPSPLAKESDEEKPKEEPKEEAPKDEKKPSPEDKQETKKEGTSDASGAPVKEEDKEKKQEKEDAAKAEKGKEQPPSSTPPAPTKPQATSPKEEKAQPSTTKPAATQPSATKPKTTDPGQPAQVQATKPEAAAPDKKAPKKDEPLKIDIEGLEQRILTLPVPAGQYIGLSAGAAGTIFYAELPSQPAPNPMAAGVILWKFDLATRKSETLASGVRSFDVTPDGKKMLYLQGESWFITPTTPMPPGMPPGAGGKGKLRTETIEVLCDPRAEWEQMFHEAWRINRDYFYAPNMHGADWPAVRKKYAQFLPHLANRGDLDRLFQWMLSELAVGHSYTMPGPRMTQPTSVPGGLLGADYELHEGRYRFKKIFGGLNWNPELRAPLTAPGVNVNVGDYLLAVQGKELKAPTNLYSLFENTAGKAIEITVGPTPDGKNSRTVAVEPIADESNLRHRDWLEGNLKKVDRATNGRVAYVYVPNTAGAGHAYFKRYFYPQVGKEAVIVDERFNGGGQIADYYIDHLRRPFTCYWATRYGEDQVSPGAAIFGPKVMIIDETAGSGGDLLPWMFRQNKLGKLVGKRTWGGLVGILGFPVLMDGGMVTAPNIAIWTEDGFIVENVGVPPDVEVEQWPADVIAGRDPQLEKAIEIVMEELQQNPPPKVKRPPYPVRVRKGDQ